MSFITSWFSRRTQVSQVDDVENQGNRDLELQNTESTPTTPLAPDTRSQQQPNAPSNTHNNRRPSDDDYDEEEEEEDEEVVIESPPTENTAPNGLSPIDLENLVKQRLLYVKMICRFMLMLTVLQIMSTLGTEHIHFLSLFSLFVPWAGFEGAKEKNFAYLRIFYWGCLIMIPANFFHYVSFEQFVSEVMAAPNLEENLKQEILFNHRLFNAVTILITILMFVTIIMVRQLSAVIRSLRYFVDHDFLDLDNRRGGNSSSSNHRGGSGGALSAEEISALASFKMQAEDLGTETEKEVCVICQDEFEVGDLAKRLNCRHVFHNKCIDAWLERSSLCPICNGDVRSIV